MSDTNMDILRCVALFVSGWMAIYLIIFWIYKCDLRNHVKVVLPSDMVILWKIWRLACEHLVFSTHNNVRIGLSWSLLLMFWFPSDMDMYSLNYVKERKDRRWISKSFLLR